MRKKILILTSSLLLCMSLCACKKDEKPPTILGNTTETTQEQVSTQSNSTEQDSSSTEESVVENGTENVTLNATIKNQNGDVIANIEEPYSFKVVENNGSYVELQDAYYNVLNYELLSSNFDESKTLDLITNYFSFVNDDIDFVNPIVHSAYTTEIDGETITYSTLNCTIYNVNVIQYVMSKKINDTSYITALYTDYNGGSYSEEEVFGFLSDMYLNIDEN